MSRIATPLAKPMRASSATRPTTNTGPGVDGNRFANTGWSVTLIALALLIGGGVVQGTITHRWQSSAQADGPETRLANIPLQLGEWDGHDGVLTDAELSAAGVTHYLMRTYTNQATGDIVTVTLMAGPTGPIAVHPPTACYRGAGYQQTGASRSILMGTSSDAATARHEFAIADFHKPARPDQPQPRIYWAWSTNGRWITPESPRLTFAGSPTLFKLYVTTERPVGSGKGGIAPAEELLQRLLPEVQRQVFHPSKSATQP